MAFLEELKSKPWFPWAVGAAVIVLIFWLFFWSTPEPGPMRTTRNPKGGTAGSHPRSNSRTAAEYRIETPAVDIMKI